MSFCPLLAAVAIMNEAFFPVWLKLTYKGKTVKEKEMFFLINFFSNLIQQLSQLVAKLHCYFTNFRAHGNRVWCRRNVQFQTLQNAQLHQRRRGSPGAKWDIVREGKYPHTTCSALSLSWRGKDNVLFHPPTLNTLYRCLFVRCFLQHMFPPRKGS